MSEWRNIVPYIPCKNVVCDILNQNLGVSFLRPSSRVILILGIPGKIIVLSLTMLCREGTYIDIYRYAKLSLLRARISALRRIYYNIFVS